MANNEKVVGPDADKVADATLTGENENSTGPNDAEQLRQELELIKEESNKQLQSLSADLRKLKGNAQRKEAELERKHQAELKALRNRVRQSELAALSDDDREKYLKQVDNQEVNELREQIQELENERQRLQGKEAAVKFFVDQGISIKDLDLDGATEDVVNSGYKAIASELEELRKLKETTNKKKTEPESKETKTTDESQKKDDEPIKPKPAQKVAGATGGAESGATWDDTIEKHVPKTIKDRNAQYEYVFRLVDQGQLPPSVIPIQRED